ncbi:helix-turn-helix domain-containing protein [Dyadobacter frigoris]|uniref:AraC family transcriptional regulator n=1 Tax=Dyadobacter frigoris TaxID=2576211 RepID=A0A4U6D285_9BACT|nr:AraC family transcriptional regulator [Dyadobacter frigoris]
MCKMSKPRFRRMFQTVTVKTFVNFYTQIRMERALKLLNENRACSISNLAISSGYKNVQEFSKSFVKYYGYTPYSVLIRDAN